MSFPLWLTIGFIAFGISNIVWFALLSGKDSK